MKSEVLTSNDRLALIRQTLTDLEKHGHNCDWGQEADLKWCVGEIDRLNMEMVSYRAELTPADAKAMAAAIDALWKAKDQRSSSETNGVDAVDAARYRWLRDFAGNEIMRKLMGDARANEWDRMVDEDRPTAKTPDSIRTMIEANLRNGPAMQDPMLAKAMDPPPYIDGSSGKTTVRNVGCEGADGLLRTHPESETCDVCAGNGGAKP